MVISKFWRHIQKVKLSLVWRYGNVRMENVLVLAQDSSVKIDPSVGSQGEGSSYLVLPQEIQIIFWIVK